MNKVTARLVQNENHYTLALEGEVNINSNLATWLPDIVEQLEQNGIEFLIIELAGVESIDSQGLKYLLDIHRELSKRDIKVTLQNPGSHLRRLLRIMQFDRIFIIETTSS